MKEKVASLLLAAGSPQSLAYSTEQAPRSPCPAACTPV